MFYIKSGTDLEQLRKYGFRLGKEYPECKSICNKSDFTDWYLLPVEHDEEGNEIISLVDEDYELPAWELKVISTDNGQGHLLMLDLAPDATFHIMLLDFEKAMSVILELSREGILEEK